MRAGTIEVPQYIPKEQVSTAFPNKSNCAYTSTGRSLTMPDCDSRCMYSSCQDRVQCQYRFADYMACSQHSTFLCSSMPQQQYADCQLPQAVCKDKRALKGPLLALHPLPRTALHTHVLWGCQTAPAPSSILNQAANVLRLLTIAQNLQCFLCRGHLKLMGTPSGPERASQPKPISSNKQERNCNV